MQKPYRVLFWGTPDLGVLTLQALHNDPRFEVVAAISQPDKPQGRKQEYLPTPIKAAAMELGIPVLQPERLKGDVLQEIADFAADFFVLIAYGKILKQEVLDMPAIAPINAHVSLLPRWRGASPIQAALLAGDKETGVTYMRMTAGMDEGPILHKEISPIKEHSTAGEAFEGLAALTAKHMGDVLATYAETREEKPQNDAMATHCTKISREMGEINWQSMTAQEIHQRWQAFTPWPGIYTFAQGKRVKLLDVYAEEGDLAPGIIEHAHVGTKQGVVRIEMLQLEGKKPMKADDFFRGTSITQFDLPA